MKVSRTLLLILLLGAALRFLFIAFSDHIFYPDEIYQFAEQGYRLVYGYGLIPWEFRVGMRSWLVPGVIAGWLWLLKGVGVTTPRLYIPVIQGFFIVLSLSLVISTYAVLKRVSGSTRLALLAAFVMAVWYELIYFAPRPLMEVLAAYSLIGALAVLVNAKRQIGIGVGAFLTGLGLMMRPHYVIILPGLIWAQYRYSRTSLSLRPWVAGLGLSIISFGGLDWFTWGAWFHSTWQHLRLSLLAEISQAFGTEPGYYYLATLLIASGGMYLLGLRSLKAYFWLWGLVGAVLFVHSLIPHKQHRFIFLAIPLLLMLTAMGGYQLCFDLLKNRRLASVLMLTVVLGISSLGMMDRLPWQAKVYWQPMLKRWPRLHFFKQMAEIDDVCGVWDTTADWVVTGGYYYLGRPVPQYALTNPPPSTAAVNYVIAFRPLNDEHKWQEVAAMDGVKLYKRGGRCLADVNYTYHRYIPLVEKLLPAN